MTRSHQTPAQADTKTLPTVLEHIHELRTRLFWVVGFILVASSASYLIKDQILTVLTEPLGSQQLYYLTPIGGLSFIIKVCFYFGILVSVPLIIYHLFRYLQPLMNGSERSVVKYMFCSSLLAILGVLFAYFVSLPAALHFLTDFNLNQITAMLTVDSYLTFVTSYLLAAALLFQIPLVLLIINHITPLSPKGLMRYERHVILIAFIAAAIISPTPDIINQALLAGPIIVMYQIGVIAIFVKNRQRHNSVATPPVQRQVELAPAPVTFSTDFNASNLAPQSSQPAVDPIAKEVKSVVSKPQPQRQSRLISDFGPGPKGKTVVAAKKPITRQASTLSRSLIPERHVRLERPKGLAPIDGVFPS